MHYSEFLEQAKKVPLGQKRRVYHGAESTKAMDVYNSPTGYSAYCHRCHDYGSFRKEFVEPIKEVAPVYRKYLDTRKLIALEKLQEQDYAAYAKVVLHLADKGMSSVTVSSLAPKYNPVDQRLVFRFDGVDLGRDLTGRSPMKWFKYHKDMPKSYVYLQGKKMQSVRETVILTEDLYSAQKIRYYTGHSTLCLLGTKLTDEALHLLMNRMPVLALDGDIGGVRGTRSIVPKFNLVGIPYEVCTIPDGLDPKDMNPLDLIKLFKFLELQNA